MAFDPSTYQPGDPWVTKDFRSRAITAPQIETVATAAGDATEGSYFESVRGRSGERFVEASARRSAGGGTYTYQLQRSHDDGATWQVIREFTDQDREETVRYNSMYKLRWYLVSVDPGTEVTFCLYQHI